MCNACGFYCCGRDNFYRCGCDCTESPDCWVDDEDEWLEADDADDLCDEDGCPYCHPEEADDDDPE